MRKKYWGICGALALGTLFLAGCARGQKDVAVDVPPQEPGKTGTEGGGSDAPEGNEGKVTLTLGVLDKYAPGLSFLVDTYNAQSEKYYVEIVDYLPESYDNAVWEASVDRFRMDLATGKGTDIVQCSDLVPDDLGYAGVLMDLKPFLTAEDAQEKYLGNILECAQTGDALYEVSPAFTLGFIAGDGSKLGMETGWTLEEMLSAFGRNGRDGAALAKGGVRTAAQLISFSLEDYVDWDTGTADFCKEEFYRILEFGREADTGEFIRPTQETVAAGTHLASCEGFVSVADMQYLKWLFGENAAVKGYPCSHGTGVAVDIGQDSMGICSYSQCPEGAWDFLEFYMDGSWTEAEHDAGGERVKGRFSHYFAGFPLNRQLFEEMLAQSMVQQYFPDTGDPVPLLAKGDNYPDFYANTKEDVEMLREAVASADRRAVPMQSAILQIIEEEVSGYNAGTLTTEQTAANIQNRMQLYLEEQK